LLGGVLTGDCHVKLGALPHYHLIASVAQADLQQFAQSNLAGQQKLKGKILAQVNLQGSGGPKNLVGTGTVHLSDADVYELPVMVSLLKIARAKSPDSTAFTQSDINFAIQGEHVTLNQINLDGDAISLSGHGELTLDGQSNPINLELHSTVGRGTVPLLSGLLSEASQHIMLIYVNGTLDHPTTRAEAFPTAQGALQQLQGDGERSTLLPRPGAIMRNLGVGR
jgi:AsmA-like protein